MSLTTEQLFLIELINCSISDKAPNIPPKNIDWTEFTKIVDQNRLRPIIYYGLKKIDEKYLPNDYLIGFKNILLTNFMLEHKHEELLKSITQKFNENNIDCVLIKGLDISKLYPNNGMRTVGDIDIIVKKKNIHKAKIILLDLGLNIIKTEGSQMAFIFNNSIIVELEPELYDDFFCEKKNTFVIDWNNLLDNKLISGLKRINNEMYFAYLIAHIYKHLTNIGIGIRHIIDLPLFYNSVKDNFNKDKFYEIIDTLNADKFLQTLIKLCNDYFDANIDLEFKCDGEIFPETLLEMIFERSGFFGGDFEAAKEISNNISMGKGNKFSYFLNRLFPSIKAMKLYFNYVKMFSILYPISLVHLNILRVIKLLGFFRNKKNPLLNLKEEFDTMNQNETKKQSETLIKLGLKK